jgi:hypothetical protein
MRSVLAVLAGYLTFAVSGGVLFAVTGVDPHAAPTPLFAIGAIVYGMVFAALGGCVAAMVSRDASDKHACFVAAIIAGFAIVSLAVSYPRGSVWSQLAAILLMAPSAVIGSVLRRRLGRAGVLEDRKSL